MKASHVVRLQNPSKSHFFITPMKTVLLFSCASALMGFLSGCELVPAPPDLVEAGDSIVLYDNLAAINPNPVTEQGTVCDPFQNNPGYVGSNKNLGIIGDLYYLSDDQPHYSSAKQYVEYGHHVPIHLFFDQLNVPTRKFDLGFQTLSGAIIKNQNGNTLYEYFGMKLETELKLASGDAPGKYQIAILSDDGVLLEVDETGAYDVLIDNDGVHSTRMGCATRSITLDGTHSIPMRLHYYQGPRYHISLVVLMREWTNDPSFDPNDPSCGKQGNNLYFDYSQVPSTPQKAYLSLLSRGWKVLTYENYQLPQAVTQNPCILPENLKTYITKFTPSGDVTSSADVTFEFTSNYPNVTFQCGLDGGTEVPCTSPVTYTNLLDGNHTFVVRAVDSNHIPDPVGASYSWRIDRIPPILTFISTTNSSSTIQIDWSTSEPATTLVKWGDTAATLNLIPEDSVYQTMHTAILNGLTPQTVYYFYVGGTDQAGNSFLSPRFATSTKP